jgi:predicted RNA binding protein YcfA (HicA-like mRNA interferase family)
LGYVLDRTRGSHAVYYRQSDHARIVIPVHPGKTIKPKTPAAILDDMVISADDLRELL